MRREFDIGFDLDSRLPERAWGYVVFLDELCQICLVALVSVLLPLPYHAVTCWNRIRTGILTVSGVTAAFSSFSRLVHFCDPGGCIKYEVGLRRKDEIPGDSPITNDLELSKGFLATDDSTVAAFKHTRTERCYFVSLLLPRHMCRRSRQVLILTQLFLQLL